MNLDFSPEQLAVRDLAGRFARERLAPEAARLARDEEFPVEQVRELATLGLMGINVPRRYGGLQAGPVAGALAGMELAYHDAAFTVCYSVTNMVAELIARFGTEAQRQKFLPRITSGEALCAAFALSETSSASDSASLRTRAERRGGEFILNGSKQWISHGAYAGVVVVWARSEAGSRGARGISAFLVEGGRAGLTAGPPEQKMGLRSSKTVGLHFEDCVVAAEDLLGVEGEGFKLAMAALDGGRINIGSQACGVARAALDAGVRLLKDPANLAPAERRCEEASNLLADPATELAAAELMTLRAAWLKEQGRPFTQEASMAKVFSSEMAQRACERALQLHGYAGVFGDLPVERYFRDARVQTIYEGTSEIQRLVIARDLLKE